MNKKWGGRYSTWIQEYVSHLSAEGGDYCGQPLGLSIHRVPDNIQQERYLV